MLLGEMNMEKPILENYEKQIDVDCFALTNDSVDKFEEDNFKYFTQQENINDMKSDIKKSLDGIVEHYNGRVKKSVMRDILEEVSNEVIEKI